MSATDPTVEIPSALPIAEPGVVLWGAPGAGKSGLLGALYAASMRHDAEGWSAHPRDCDDAYTQQRLKDAYLGLIERANPKTGLPGGTEYAPLRLMLRRTHRRRETAALRVALIDPAGEFSTQLDLAGTASGRALFARVARASGVLWLFEAAPDDGSDRLIGDAIDQRLLALQHLVALLEQSGGVQLGIPVALCFSKIDRLPPAQREAARLDPATALRTQLGETAFTWFEAVCPAMRCFAISSTGEIDGRVQPEGAEAVFDWLREHVERRPSLRARLGQFFDAIPRPPRSAVRTLGIVAIGLGAAGVLGAAGAAVNGGTRVRTGVRSMLASLRRTASRTVSRPPIARASTGEVAPRTRRAAAPNGSRDSTRRETIESKATVSDGVAAAQLTAATSAAGRGEWGTTLAVLGASEPPTALRFSWDSLHVVAALAAAADANDENEARALYADARDRATLMVRRGPAGSRRLASVRYARAAACLDGQLGCADAQVRDDLTWSLLGPSEVHAAARERLSAWSSRTVAR